MNFIKILRNIVGIIIFLISIMILLQASDLNPLFYIWQAWDVHFIEVYLTWFVKHIFGTNWFWLWTAGSFILCAITMTVAFMVARWELPESSTSNFL